MVNVSLMKTMMRDILANATTDVLVNIVKPVNKEIIVLACHVKMVEDAMNRNVGQVTNVIANTDTVVRTARKNPTGNGGSDSEEEIV